MAITDNSQLFPLPIPPIEHERHIYRPAFDSFMSRSERRRQTGDYHSAVPAMLAEYKFDIPTDISANMEEAAHALGRFDAYAAVILIDILVRCRHIVRGMRARLWNVSPMPASMPPLRVSN